MGNHVHYLSETVSYIASADLWIDDSAIQQLHTTANLPDMQRVVGMPDLHSGRGYPIGAAFFSLNRLYPALVGNDIGCGMALWQTDILSRQYRADKQERRLAAMPDMADAAWLDAYAPRELTTHPWRSALGSIGGGNHFAELQQVDQLFDTDLFQAAGLASQQLLLLVHSGSRGLGEAILQRHLAAFSHEGLVENSVPAQQYLAEHHAALTFAETNRQLIAMRMLQQLHATGQKILDITHNSVTAATINGQQGWLHRKGATPDDHGLVIIPGSRGDYSWLVRPIASDFALHSLAHGTGRKWMRTQCKGRLASQYSPAQLARTELGSRVICRDKQLLYEEAPQAYKPAASVVNCLIKAGRVEPVARLRPVLTLKTTGGKNA